MIPATATPCSFCHAGASSPLIENIAIEIRWHLQRTEVLEAEESFSPQGGSSSMPHKRNPVLTET